MAVTQNEYKHRSQVEAMKQRLKIGHRDAVEQMVKPTA